MEVWWLLVILANVTLAQKVSFNDLPSAQLKAEHRGEIYDCMDYWECSNRYFILYNIIIVVTLFLDFHIGT